MASIQPTATSTAATGTVQHTGAAALGADMNTFLTLLTTQLKNQDPEHAMDTAQMTTQLVQFASVEQQVKMNSNLQSLVSLQQTAQLVASAPLIGRKVEVESDTLSVQNGSATLRLPAAGSAQYARVQVQDAAGRQVAEYSTALGAGTTDWVWNGRDANGKQLPDGAYRFSVTGADGNGVTMPLAAGVIGTVSGASQLNGHLNLSVGAANVGFDKIRRIDPA